MSGILLVALMATGLMLVPLELSEGDEDDAADPVEGETPTNPTDPTDPDTPTTPDGGTGGEDPVAALDGTEGADTLMASPGQVVNGLGGADELTALSSNATLNGGDGQDTLFLEGTITEGETNTSQANGDAGDDTITAIGLGGSVDGGGGDDVIDVQGRLDRVEGGNGDDTISGGAADYGGGSPLIGGAGNDVLSTSDDAGFDYRSELDGGAGNDTLTNNLLNAQPEAIDAFTGGEGADTFAVTFNGGGGEPSAGAALGTVLEVTDFAAAEDVLQVELSGFPVFEAETGAPTQTSFALDPLTDGSGTRLDFTVTNADSDAPITGSILLTGVTGLAEADVDFQVTFV